MDPSTLDAELRPLVGAGRLLATVGRSVEPPVGSFERVLARASRRKPRPAPALRWAPQAMGLATIAVLLLSSLGGAAYASTPGDPLFEVQRALDRLYVDLPRTDDQKVRVSLGVADRRVRQAARAARSATPDVLRVTLDDALRYLESARATAAQVNDEGQRKALTAVLLLSVRDALVRLEGAQDDAHGESDDVLSETKSTLERHEAQDRKEVEVETDEKRRESEQRESELERREQTAPPQEQRGSDGDDGVRNSDAEHSPLPAPAPGSHDRETDEEPDEPERP